MLKSLNFSRLNSKSRWQWQGVRHRLWPLFASLQAPRESCLGYYRTNQNLVVPLSPTDTLTRCTGSSSDRKLRDSRTSPVPMNTTRN